MTFYSCRFLFLFLPLALCLFGAAHHCKDRKKIAILLVSLSALFYATWSAYYVPLLALSIVCNFYLGRYIRLQQSKLALLLGIFGNLSILGYFKYANFFLEAFSHLTRHQSQLMDVALPVGISFYTFQQIAWLADNYLNKLQTKTDDFWTYALFVSFFPQLLAGPIVRYDETAPQFSKTPVFNFKWSSLAVGLSLFIFGMIKKLIIADNLAKMATPEFDTALTGPIPLVNAWFAAIAFTFQVYFDFSGYSDMAVGVGRMFNVRLPMNFNSPYKASSITELWKRWHMSMTRFFLDYVYTPLSIYLFRAQRKHGVPGNLCVYASSLITFVIIGLWHGPKWTFILFGSLHGCAGIFSRVWNDLSKKRKVPPISRRLGWALTFIFFVLTCVIYRSENLLEATNMFHSMFTPVKVIGLKFKPLNKSLFLLAAGIICLFLPNSQQVMQRYRPVADLLDTYKLPSDSRFLKYSWRPPASWTAAMIVMSIIGINSLLDANKVQQFIYFKF